MMRFTKLLPALAFGLTTVAIAPARAADDPVAPCRALARASLAHPRAHDTPRLTLSDAPGSNTGVTESDFKELVASPAVRASLADIDPAAARRFSRLPGEDVYMSETVEGTLDCQTLGFYRGRPGPGLRAITAPPNADGLCWTDTGQLGTIANRPGFIETSSSTTDPREDIVFTPWTGSGWGTACQVRLRHRTEMVVKEAFCGDTDVCRAVQALAPDLAGRRDRHPDAKTFRYGPPPIALSPERLRALLAKAPGYSPTEGPAFPTFGGQPRTEYPAYAYGDIVTFTLTLSGRTYVAAIGHGGVGWRLIGDYLLSVFVPQGDALVPVAGVVIAKRDLGLASATAQAWAPRARTR